MAVSKRKEKRSTNDRFNMFVSDWFNDSFFANIFFQESKFGPEQEMQTSLKTIACLTTPNFELKKKYQQKLTNLYNAHDYLWGEG